jgi:predicted RNA-binding protein with PIN domain
VPYIIDGHNLIPHIPGLSLADLDDEIALVHILQKFAAQQRTKVEVYFDRAPPTQSRIQIHGLIKAIFVSQDQSADDAIRKRLTQLKKEAKNWTIVSSDREILAQAREAQSRLLKSGTFVKYLLEELSADHPEGSKGETPDPSNLEVDYWLDQFTEE